MDTVRSLSTRTPVIMIARRQSTVQECDRILMLEQEGTWS